MLELDGVDLNNESTTYVNDKTAVLTLDEIVNSGTQLHILDQRALEALDKKITLQITNIDNKLTTKVDGVIAEYKEADKKVLEEANKHSDTRLETYKTEQKNKETKIDLTLKGLIADYKKLTSGLEGWVDGKDKKVYDTLNPKISEARLMAENNKVDLDRLKNNVEFHLNGTLKFAGLIDKSSDDIDNMLEQDKNDELTQQVAWNGFAGEPRNGYFIRSKDGVAYFYVEGKWQKSDAEDKAFTVEGPISFHEGKIGLKLDNTSGLSINASGQLTFSPGDGTSMSDFAKKNAEETITKAWTFKNDATFEDAVVIKSQDTTFSISVLPNDGNSKEIVDSLVISSSNDSGKVEIIAADGIELNTTNGNIKFSRAPVSAQALQDDEIPTLKQVKDEIKAGMKDVDTTPYTGSDAIEIDGQNKISLKVDANSGFTIDATNGLTLDITKSTGFDNIANKLDVDAKITAAKEEMRNIDKQVYNTLSETINTKNREITEKIAADNEELDRTIREITAEVGQFDVRIDARVESAKEELKKNDSKLKETIKTEADKLYNHLKAEKTKLEGSINQVNTTVTNLSSSLDKKIEDKVSESEKKMSDKILDTDLKVENNIVDLQRLKTELDFTTNGTLRLVAMLEEDSSKVDEELKKDPNCLNKSFYGDPKNGYFVRCKDEIAYYYIDGKWVKGKAAGQVFTVANPVKFEDGTIKLALANDSGLSTDATSGSLTFDPANSNKFEDFAKKSKNENVSGAWTFSNNVIFKEALLLSSEDTTFTFSISPSGRNSETLSIMTGEKDKLAFIAGLDIDFTSVDGNINFNKAPVSSVDATKDSELTNLRTVKSQIEEAKITYTGKDPIKVSDTHEISLEIDTTSGLEVNNDNKLAFNLTKTTQFSSFTKKDTAETITKGWTFQEGITLSKNADQDMQAPTWRQVKDKIGEDIKNITPYTGEGAININEDRKVSLKVDEASGLSIKDGTLTFTPAGTEDFEGFLTANADAVIRADWAFNTAPTSSPAQEDYQLATLGQVNSANAALKTELKNEIDTVSKKAEQNKTDLNNSIEQLKQTVESNKSEIEQKVEEAKTTAKSENDQLKTELTGKITEATTNASDATNNLRTELESKIDQLKTEARQADAELKAGITTDLTKMNSYYSEEKTKIENKINETKTTLESKITTTVDTKVNEAKAELTKADQDLKAEVNKTFNDLHNHYTTIKTGVDTEIAGVKKSVTDMQTNLNNTIATKIDASEKKLVGYIKETDIKAENNRVDLDRIKMELDFTQNGTLRLVALLDKTSSEVETENGKDPQYLDKLLASEYPNGMKDGYFVRCSDEIAFYYIGGKWHKGKAAGHAFTTENPIKFEEGKIKLSIDTTSGLKESNGSLTFDPTTSNKLGDFTKRNVNEKIDGAWTFNNNVILDQALLFNSEDGTVTLGVTPNGESETFSISTAENGKLGFHAGKGIDFTTIEGDISFSKAPISVDASKDNEIPTWKQVKAEDAKNKTEIDALKQTVESNKTTLEGKIDSVKSELNTTISNNKSELETKIENTKNSLTSTIEQNKTTLEGTIQTNKNELKDEIDKAKQELQTSISNIKVPEYTGVDAINVNNHKISVNVDQNSGLTTVGGAIKLDITKNSAFNDYTKKNQSETIQQKWNFSGGLTTTQNASSNNDVPNWRQVQDEIKKSPAFAGVTWLKAGTTPTTSNVPEGNLYIIK